ncbi:protein of unknown function [Halomonas shengliensis]|uniref:DUF4258 domain-containing protein n=2 Tax=Halomonas shengliensis TaxID=419597 RepID=A0A1H0NQ64_9GAMM|nr:protein of unknown function [Halomonas shengliensis]
MFCERFGLPVHVTRHAAERKTERGISLDQLLELLEHGTVRYKDDIRMWVAKAFTGRDDNLVCAAVIIEDRLVVKTVMHHFQWEP